MKLILLILGALLWASAPAPVELRSKVDKAVINVDDEVLFQIELEHDAGAEAEIPDIGPQIRTFRIVDFGTDPATKVDGRFLKRRWYKLHADVQGSYVLPALKIEYKNAAGETKQAETSEIFIEAKNPDPGEQKPEELGADIRDIKPLIPMGFWLPIWAWILIALLIVTALCVGIWVWLKRKAKLRPLVEVPPHVQALCRLEDLKRDQYHRTGDVKRFAFELSEIARVYVERKYQFSATDMTLEEIRRRIDKLQDFDAELKEKYLRVLSETDVVKFTDFGMVPDRGDELLSLTEHIVEATSPKDLQKEPAEAVI